jgi:hypothetical protein
VITGSIVLALVAAVFLGLGLLASNPDLYFYCSIVGSVLAGFALFAGLRYRLGAQLPDDDFDGPRPSDRGRPMPGPGPRPTARPGSRPVGRAPGRATGRASVAAVLESHGGADGWEERETREQPEWNGSDWVEGEAVATQWPDDDAGVRLPDEPDEQTVSAAIAARVAELTAEVAVIDGRPRYHLDECLHLLGRSVQRVPVMDAVEFGFTPCGDCEPATTLLLSS